MNWLIGMHRTGILVSAFICPLCLLSNGCMQSAYMSFNESVNKPLDINLNEAILEYHKPVVPPSHKDYVLHELMRGLLFFEQGDYMDSDARFANACRVMEQIAGDEGREIAAVAWTEASKTYKGEPYERATAYFYRGLCRYKLGDYSGALAAFRHSLACDAETRTEEQKYLEDFTVSHFMAALCYSRLGELDNAKAALRMARRHASTDQYLNPDVLGKNFIAIIAVGQGPHLMPSAVDASIKRMRCPECVEKHVEVSVDGEVVGSAVEITDLGFQAKTQGWGEMDTIRLGKSVGKRVLSYVPFVSLATLAIREEVDIRCWWGLPRKYYVFAADAAPKLHTVSLKFRSREGEDLPRYEQTWFDIRVQDKAGEVFYFRGLRNCQNYYGVESIPLRE